MVANMKMKPLLISSVVLFIGLLAIFYLRPALMGKIWEAASWRAELYLLKAEGYVPEISWNELVRMTLPGSKFQLSLIVTGGVSLNAAIRNPYDTRKDRQNGKRIFHENCAGCHGGDATGGLHGPSLAGPGLKHSDTDFSIYKVLRDGISGTPMLPTGLSLVERWQVVSFIRSFQSQAAPQKKFNAPQLNIQVSSEQIINAGDKPDEWVTYSGSLNGWRHSPLTEITPANVAQLKVHWIQQFETDNIGFRPVIESTPIVVDNVIFTVIPPATVVAVDARTGAEIWQYKRNIPAKLPLCCGPVNRGLAILGHTLFLGTLDNYLVAINANTGKMIWETRVAKSSDWFSMTGAPLIANHSVIVGVAGGEYGIRGFLAAYNAETGQLEWKFHTIPRPGEIGHESWSNDAWKTGGGPTWVTGSYDPSLGLIYWGVGNPSPEFQGDARPGDNLFTNSVIALHADTGKLAWYFQFTPHDEHDWDSGQTPILADLSINGDNHKVICWANRNGFYYVLDRITGKFLVGKPFVEQNWTKGLDSAGRPMPLDSSVAGVDHFTRPGNGGTNWENSAYDPQQGLFFVPVREDEGVFTKTPPERLRRAKEEYFVGSALMTSKPDVQVVRALNAATGNKKWEYYPPVKPGRRRSGLLATAGGLVFGASGQILFALDATSGRELWRVSLGGGISAAPISFTVGGHQVILVTAGRALLMLGL
jgi:alcohol dehydrogenase (cytochrome c)